MNPIQLFVSADHDLICRHVADLIAATVARPDPVLGLATGRTPLPIYAELVRRIRKGELDLDHVVTFNLDEYYGLSADHPASFTRYMRRELFDPANMPRAHTHFPDMADDSDNAAARYENAITGAGGIDLMLLGIGQNGHIGFNEPGAPRLSRTRWVRLHQSTRDINGSDFPIGETTPETAMTMGIATILDAKEIILVATGPSKAASIAASLTGPIGPDNPGSFLRLHPNMRFYCDLSAASEAIAAGFPAQDLRQSENALG